MAPELSPKLIKRGNMTWETGSLSSRNPVAVTQDSVCHLTGHRCLPFRTSIPSEVIHTQGSPLETQNLQVHIEKTLSCPPPSAEVKTIGTKYVT